VPYIPVTETQREEMLKRLGIHSTAELFEDIPEPLRFPTLSLGEGKSELEVLREIGALAGKNATADDFRWFLGAGVYDHFIPQAVSYLSSRGEFVTAYTPYQPEVSQGTLQAVFEYQSMIAELTGMDVVNASHYDGATALAEAILMGIRGNEGRDVVLLPSALHPEYKQVIKTYLTAYPVRFQEYEGAPASAIRATKGSSDREDLAVVVASYPDFFGQIPDLSGAAQGAHDRGALFIVHADPLMLGLLKSPGEWGADVVTAEGQGLGNEMNYGGPFLGVMATTNALVRRLPGRIVGEARDSEGRRGYVLTLVAREQHIRREKAVSNICSNQGLATLRSCIYLALMGKQGLRSAAELCWHRSHYAANQLAALRGCSVQPGTFFKEFVLRLPVDAEGLAQRLYHKKIVPGLPLSRYYAERKNELLICVTEKTNRSDIDELVRALGEEIR